MIPLKLRLIREKNRTYSAILRVLWKIQGKDSARVFMFHSVVDTPEEVYSKFAITKTSFEHFLKYELQRGQKPMDFQELKAAVCNPRKFQGKFIVSFDDIYDSVYTNAFPILKELEIPFIIFVTTDLIDKKDPGSGNDMISLEHLKDLLQDNLCILGSHGTEHKVFRQYSAEETKDAMISSKQLLETEFGHKVDCFAFPYGRIIEVSRRNIHPIPEVPYDFAFSAIDGSLRQKWVSGQYFLPRILVGEDFVKKHTR